MAKCEGPCKQELVGFSWIRRQDDSWKRLILRECFRCRDRMATEIHYINTDNSVCSWCFSQDIDAISTDEGVKMRCSRCDRTDMWLLNVPEPPEMDGGIYEED